MSNLSVNPLVSIIILNYNAGNLLSECIKSIFKTTYDNFEVIVVDNASKDDSHKKCKMEFEKILLIENTQNLGYCEGNNVGIKQAKGDYLVILNPDTTVKPTWLDELLLAYDTFGDGIYQPKLLSMENPKKFNSAGNMIHIFGFGYSRGKDEEDIGQYDKPKVISYASGACLFTSSKIINKIGLFDPFLFAYHDDLDLGWRAAQIGLKSYYIPKSIVYHADSSSFKWGQQKFFLLERNRHYCLLTLYSRSTFLKILPSLILVEIAMLVFYLSKGLLQSKIKGYFDIIKNTKHISKRYKELQKIRSISDKELIKNFQNEIFVPGKVVNSTINQIFNNFFSILSRLSRVVI
jgi:hypothetical protein